MPENYWPESFLLEYKNFYEYTLEQRNKINIFFFYFTSRALYTAHREAV